MLVCCAGIGGDSLHTEDVSDEEWERVHAINLNGVFYANRAALPKMKAGGYGRIVNVASVAGKEGNPMAGAYSSSQGGRDRRSRSRSARTSRAAASSSTASRRP